MEGVEGGTRRLYAFSSLPQAPDNDIFVNVGISTDQAMAQINDKLLRNLAALALAALAGMLLAWVASDIMLTSRTKALAQAAQRLSAGDLSVRSGMHGGNDEIGHLAQSFDDMATSLQQRTNELSASEQRQRILAEVGEIFSKLTRLFVPARSIHRSCAGSHGGLVRGECARRALADCCN